MTPVQDKDKYIPGEEREDPPIGLYKIVKMDGGEAGVFHSRLFLAIFPILCSFRLFSVSQGFTKS